MVKDNILALIKKNHEVQIQDLMGHFNISRQAVHKHLKPLLMSGDIIKTGTTRAATYSWSDQPARFERQVNKCYALASLSEDVVFKQIAIQLQLKHKVSANSLELLQYTFTEMLNNAIDHSQATHGTIACKLTAYDFEFVIRDHGIGLFKSIQQFFNLSDEAQAATYLMKGKVTTQPERHTGEGIFFTSKAGDLVRLRSHRLQLLFDNQQRDVFIEQDRFIKGTEVYFKLALQSKRSLQKIFNQYAPPEYDYQFQKTQVIVSLLQKHYVSRSEAKRILSGLEKFKEIVFDFKGVKTIGQGFADELFRVFQNSHPLIRLKTVHTTTSIRAMIQHVVDN